MYAYANGNPVMMVDPDGRLAVSAFLATIPIWVWIGAALFGAALGGGAFVLWRGGFAAMFSGGFGRGLGQGLLLVLSALGGAVVMMALYALIGYVIVRWVIPIVVTAAIAIGVLLGFDRPSEDSATLIIHYNAGGGTGTLPQEQRFETPGWITLADPDNLTRPGRVPGGWRCPGNDVRAPGTWWYATAGNNRRWLQTAVWYITGIAQQTEYLCWAASAQMATGTTKTQDEITELAGFSGGATLEETQEIANLVRAPGTPLFNLQHSPRTQAQVRNSIRAGYPVIVQISYHLFVNHLIVIAGWCQLPDGTYYYLVHDPLPVGQGTSGWITFDRITSWVCPDSGWYGHWAATIWR
jgi:hypothetical protein